MLITEETLQHWLNNFFGYGSWRARLWFISFEEGGGDQPEEVSEKFNYFFDTHPPGSDTGLCDIRSLYRHVRFRIDGPRAGLFQNLFDYRFGDNAVLHGVWKNLIGFVHGYTGEPLPDLISYQRDVFASPTGKEALLRLYPLPSPHNHAWYYSWLDMPSLPFLKSRNLYQESLFQTRIQQLFDNIRTYKPEVVLMYDMSNINSLKKFIEASFPATSFKMVKAVKGQIPQHHRADLDGTILLITTQIPALRHNRAETGFDWRAFGRITRSGCPQ